MNDQLPNTAIGTLRLFATTQTQVDVFSDQLIQSVQNGEVNPIEILVQLKAFEKVSERVMKEIKPNVLREAGKYPGSSFEFNGNKIEKAELGTKYNYDTCNDPVYKQLMEEGKALSEKIKAREAFLKSLPGQTTIVDDGSGEVITLSPPLKTSAYGVKVSIK